MISVRARNSRSRTLSVSIAGFAPAGDACFSASSSPSSSSRAPARRRISSFIWLLVVSFTALTLLAHRQTDALPLRRFDRGLVTGVRMARHANAGIVRQYPLEPLTHLRRAVRDDHLPRVQRLADADTATVMERHPAGTARHVEQRIEYRPVRDRVAAILHRLRLAIRRCDGAGIEMVAPDHDRCGHRTACDEVVQCDTELRALALAEPAD